VFVFSLAKPFIVSCFQVEFFFFFQFGDIPTSVRLTVKQALIGIIKAEQCKAGCLYRSSTQIGNMLPAVSLLHWDLNCQIWYKQLHKHHVLFQKTNFSANIIFGLISASDFVLK
jgi:hypothetical protein